MYFELDVQRIHWFTNIIDRERVITGSGFGFGTFAGFEAVDLDIADAKPVAIVVGAKLPK